MAKTLMISNEVYAELKKVKGNNSFSELLKDMIKERSNLKTGKSLRKFFGVLKGDKEFAKIRKDLKPMWKKWNEMYA